MFAGNYRLLSAYVNAIKYRMIKCHSRAHIANERERERERPFNVPPIAVNANWLPLDAASVGQIKCRAVHKVCSLNMQACIACNNFD
jgi:hypothetical protein